MPIREGAAGCGGIIALSGATDARGRARSTYAACFPQRRPSLPPFSRRSGVNIGLSAVHDTRRRIDVHVRKEACWLTEELLQRPRFSTTCTASQSGGREVEECILSVGDPIPLIGLQTALQGVKRKMKGHRRGENNFPRRFTKCLICTNVSQNNQKIRARPHSKRRRFV